MRATILFIVSAALAAPKPLIFGDLIPSAESIQSTDTITSALGMVKTSVDSLDTSVKQVKPDNLGALGDVAMKSTKLGDTIKVAQKMIDGADQVDISGALQLQQSGTDLTTSITTLSDDLIKIKPTVDGAGLSPVVADMLKKQQAQSGGLAKSVANKVPSLAQDMAMDQGKQISDQLTRVVKVYMQPAAKAANNSTTAATTPAKAGNGKATAQTKQRLVRRSGFLMM